MSRTTRDAILAKAYAAKDKEIGEVMEFVEAQLERASDLPVVMGFTFIVPTYVLERVQAKYHDFVVEQVEVDSESATLDNILYALRFS